MSYTREIWQTIGVLDLLKEKHVPFLALDLPYGSKTECKPKTHDPQTILAIVHAAIEAFFPGRTPLLVGSSIGGHMALNYAVQFPVKGLLLTSPYHSLDASLLSSYGKFHFPVHIIWGSEDTVVPCEELRTLTDKLPHAKLITYEGGGHSAYITAPQRFQHDLLELYASTE
jgi:pimeloyl-ACP methyl ester carboxylesterase